MPQVEGRAAPTPFSQLPDSAYAVVQQNKLQFWSLVSCSASERDLGGDWVSPNHADRTKLQRAARHIPLVKGNFNSP